MSLTPPILQTYRRLLNEGLEGLESGDVGTLVHVHRDGEAYEVEFMTLAGDTLAVATVPSSRLRPVNKRDISHVRQLAAA